MIGSSRRPENNGKWSERRLCSITSYTPARILLKRSREREIATIRTGTRQGSR
jgi:hypothetical protein